MANVKEHYERVLSGVYSWMLGGFDAALARNTEFFTSHGVAAPRRSGVAIDLGAGCGFQSIPLAKLGYRVLAIDLDRQLLAELGEQSEGLAIKCIEDDLLDFRNHVESEIEIAVCMTDTLLHLESSAHVARMVADVFASLGPEGRLLITFRDLTHELEELDRFIPVRSDENTILTCFLEYEPDTVKVHDIVYERIGDSWKCSKSFYRKLRLSQSQVVEALERTGFAAIDASDRDGLITIVATK